MFKIISKEKYKELNNKIMCYENELNQVKDELMFENKDYELKLEDVYNMLVDIKSIPKLKKEKIIKRIEKIIRYIEKGG